MALTIKTRGFEMGISYQRFICILYAFILQNTYRSKLTVSVSAVGSPYLWRRRVIISKGLVVRIENEELHSWRMRSHNH